MSQTLRLEQPFGFVGLNTFTHTVGAGVTRYPFGGPGLYYINFTCTVPAAVPQGNGAGSASTGSSAAAVVSGLVITITQNATTLFTSPTFPSSGTDSHVSAKIPAFCANADVLTVTFASSSGVDQGLNAISGQVSVQKGP